MLSTPKAIALILPQNFENDIQDLSKSLPARSPAENSPNFEHLLSNLKHSIDESI